MQHKKPLAVICQGLTKSFGAGESAALALRGIDLEIERGELMMLVGPSGCGKTTLISIIAGILSPDSGRCTILGTDPSTLDNNAAIEFRGVNIGFIFQSYNLLPMLDVRTNVAIPLIINGTPQDEALRKADALLCEVGLETRCGSMPNELSGGQQQRVAIARALVHAPSLLVCDEPTSALDHDTGMHIMELLRQIVETRGTTLVVVTHDSRIFSFADRIATMDDGRILRVEKTERN